MQCDPSEGLGNVGDNTEISEPSQQELGQQVSLSDLQGPSLGDANKLKQMRAGIMAVLAANQESVKADLNANNEKLQQFENSIKADLAANQESVKADLNANNKKLQQFENSVKADLAAHNENINSVRADLVANQESVKAEIGRIRKGIQAENEKLISKFELKNQETKKLLEAKLDSEARRLTNLVGQVQKDAESELLAVKRQIQAVNTDLETRIMQANSTMQGVIEELANHMEEHKSEVDSTINKLGQDINNRLTRQKESIDQASTQEKSDFDNEIQQVNAKIVALEHKFMEFLRSAVVAEPHAVDNNVGSPSVVTPSDQIRGDGNGNSVLTDRNRTCSCQANSCDACTCISGNVNASRVHGPIENPQVSSVLSTSGLPLPLSDDCTDCTAVRRYTSLALGVL
jgi:hypothetical protein